MKISAVQQVNVTKNKKIPPIAIEAQLPLHVDAVDLKEQNNSIRLDDDVVAKIEVVVSVKDK